MGHQALIMVKRRKNIIPLFPLNTLTTLELMWLHTEAWNDSHFEYFAEKLQGIPLNINNLPVGYELRGRSVPRLDGRWILEKPFGCPRACVELQGNHRGFDSYSVLVSEYGEHGESGEFGGWDDNTLNDLSFLISAILIAGEPDRLVVIPLSQSANWSLGARDWGTKTRVWTPYTGDLNEVFYDKAGQYLEVVEILSTDWWKLERAKEDEVALKYLKKRRLSKEFGSHIEGRSSVLNRLFSFAGLRKR